jgi:hypothetical protein
MGRWPDLPTSYYFIPKGDNVGCGSDPRQLRLLNIGTARVRHAWAKAQIETGRSTPALAKYLQNSREELRALRAKKI